MTIQGAVNSQAAPSASHTTTFLAAEAGWSTANLPNVLFQLEPFDNWGQTKIPPLLDSNGNVITDHRGRQLKDFDFLPARISIRPEAWRLLLYTDRSHPLCGAKDLHARMRPEEGEEVLHPNAINMQKVRLRNVLNIPCWIRCQTEPTIVECLMHEQYSWLSVLLNTTLAVGPTGLMKPASPAGASAAEISPEALMLTTFLEDGADGFREPSTRLKIIFQTIASLQDKAYDKGYAHWIFLENKDKPSSWSLRANSKRHERTRLNEISIPKTETMPLAAVAWIEYCIRDAAKAGDVLPAPDKLPKHAADWIENIVAKYIFSRIGKESIVAGDDITTQVQKDDEGVTIGNDQEGLVNSQHSKGLDNYKGSEDFDLEVYEAELDAVLNRYKLDGMNGVRSN
ncbi:hypothetical protein MMC18_006297 [Xylographa bjoerkii]|nr:hypothetical protein [Xylographa bjoerkii]